MIQRLVIVLAALGVSAVSAIAQTNVRVAAWNVETVGARGSTQYNATLATLLRIEADVVGINEVASAADIQNLHWLANDGGYPHVVVPQFNPFGAMRNAVISRLPIRSHTIHTAWNLSGDPLANDLTRYHIEVTLDVPGEARDLTLIVQHWKASDSNSDQFRRAVESIRITQSLSGADVDRGATIVLGDVNEEIHLVPRTPNPFISVPSGMPGEWRLGTDLQAILTGSGIVNDPFHYLMAGTGPALSPLIARQTNGSFATRPSSGRRLDYIFTSSAILGRIPLAEVYNSSNEGFGGGLPKFGSPLPPNTSTDASDHFMVFADVTVPPWFNPPFVMTFASNTIVPGLGVVGPADVVMYDEAADTWSWVLHGQSMGLGGARISAVAVMPSRHMLICFAEPVDVPGLWGGPNGARVEPTEIVLVYPPPALHPAPLPYETPTFMFFFHGRDVGLDTSLEAIDALAWTNDNRLLLSTAGPMSVPGLTAADSDVVMFIPTRLGAQTEGQFIRYFAGSQVGLSPNTSEDINGVTITREGHLLISTLGSFNVQGAAGTGQDILRFVPTSLGQTTAGAFSIFTRMTAHGIDPTASLSGVGVVE